MKKGVLLVIVLVIILSAFSFTSCKEKEMFKEDTSFVAKTENISEFKIMSMNLRLKTITDTGLKKWDRRKDYVFEMIKKNNADIICFQEAKGSQPEEIYEAIKDEYDFVYYDRGDGEGLAIAYKKKYNAKEHGRFWLSETPDVKSKGFGTSFYRICVYVSLVNQATGESITVTNIHLDHISEKSRVEGIKLIVNRMSKFEGALVMCGDFNCSNGSAGYNTANEFLQDSQSVALESEAGSTFNNWGMIEKSNNAPIDFIFISDDYKVNKFEILDEYKEVDGKKMYYSDHYAIVSSVVKK